MATSNMSASASTAATGARITLTASGGQRFSTNNLLSSGVHADVTLSCPMNKHYNNTDRQDLPAHRCILASRSSVFLAMFDNNCTDSASSQTRRRPTNSHAIKMDNVDAHVMQALLEFIYNDRCSIGSSDKDLIDLLVAADSYELEELKRLCEEAIARQLSERSAVDVALVADRHAALTLRQRSLDFIVGNVATIARQERTARKLAGNAGLLDDVLKALSAAKLHRELAAATLPRCFFDVQVDGVAAGRIVVQLRSDICPRTAENFQALCTGEKGYGYKNEEMHLSRRSGRITCGNIIQPDGSRYPTIYGNKFPFENFQLKHDGAGTLSMVYEDRNKFFIATHPRPIPEDDGVFVCFGRVVSGMSVVRQVEAEMLLRDDEDVSWKVVVANCGQL